MPETGPRAVAIPLPDGDELWNAARAGQFLGISASTMWGYSGKRQPKNNPVRDPVALIVRDPAAAAAVRLLMAVDARVPRGRAGPEPPRLWRASKIRAWNTARPGRGNWSPRGTERGL
jgi:hypothetical protein